MHGELMHAESLAIIFAQSFNLLASHMHCFTSVHVSLFLQMAMWRAVCPSARNSFSSKASLRACCFCWAFRTGCLYVGVIKVLWRLFVSLLVHVFANCLQGFSRCCYALAGRSSGTLIACVTQREGVAAVVPSGIYVICFGFQ